MGNGFLSSDGIQITPSPNTEIIPNSPSDWTFGYNLTRFDFININQDCTVKINNKDTLKLIAGIGFSSSIGDIDIESFIIVEAGTEYYFNASY